MDPVEELRTIEDIRQLKYRYLRCVDTKLWDEIGDTFTEDATVDYGTKAYGKPLKMSGRDEIVAFFRIQLGPGILTAHAAGQPEITVDGDTATGIWSFRDTVIATEFRVVIAGAAFYHDRYERGADGHWRIAHTGYVRTYETMMSLDDLPSLKMIAKLDADEVLTDADAVRRDRRPAAVLRASAGVTAAMAGPDRRAPGCRRGPDARLTRRMLG